MVRPHLVPRRRLLPSQTVARPPYARWAPSEQWGRGRSLPADAEMLRLELIVARLPDADRPAAVAELVQRIAALQTEREALKVQRASASTPVHNVSTYIIIPSTVHTERDMAVLPLAQRQAVYFLRDSHKKEPRCGRA